MIKPVPLTKDAEMPCIIAHIQDDSPMGRYVKQCWGHDKLFMREYTICNINADMAAKVGVAKSTPLSIHMFEIIGTLVEEGSADWALYQMMQGEKVCHEKSQSIIYCEHAGYIRREVRYNCVDHMSVSVWLNGADNTGWQIYEEPKPTFKVGDWVKYDIDTYLQVTEASGVERTWCKTLSGIAVYPYTSCLSKIKPSEVIVKTGT